MLFSNPREPASRVPAFINAGHMETIARSKSPYGPYESCPHNFDATNGFQVQHRVLKELGCPEIRTISDFENVLR